jgi:demethylmenaquinone methyltransferase/2-methoxy-6-polyprenyl-1,4-benzoquinol methylase
VTDWDRAARLYDFQLFLERRAIDLALELAAVRPGDGLLDLGTGTGVVLRRLAARADAPREVVGVDRSASMLAVVRDLPNGWRLVRADVTALPFPNESFDVVMAAYLLHLLDPPARRAVVAEAGRVLRPSGRLISVTVVIPRSTALALAFAPLEAIARRAPGIMAGLRVLDPRGELIDGGFCVRAARRTGRGYPSLVVAAERRE